MDPQSPLPSGPLPLPECLMIIIFSLMTPADQLTAAKVSPEWALAVQKANKEVRKSLIITCYDDLRTTRSLLKPISLHLKPCMLELAKLTTSAESEGQQQHPPPYSLGTVPPSAALATQWNCLPMSAIFSNNDNGNDNNTDCINLVSTIFSAVTDLKLLYNADHFERALALLQRGSWFTSGQATSTSSASASEASLTLIHYHYWISPAEAARLFTALRRLPPVLQRLAIEWQSNLPLRLFAFRPFATRSAPLLSRLKVLTVMLFDRHTTSFLRHLQKAAAFRGRRTPSPPLQLHLLSKTARPEDLFAAHSNSLCRRRRPLHWTLVRYGKRELDFSRDRVPQLCATFPALCSLSISGLSTGAHLTALFASLSSLPALLHLELNVDLSLVFLQEPLQLQVPVSSSVRALDLWLTCASCHDLLPRLWLALMAWALPRLQVLCLKDLRCTACATSLQAALTAHRNFTGGGVTSTTDLEMAAIGCVHQSLQRFQRFQEANAAAAAAAAAAEGRATLPISLMVYDVKEERSLPVSQFLANLLDMLFEMRNPRGGPAAVAAEV
ncbi:hypothetical protein TYRP_012721 [Tyrophagus putrescentiae]|nr:hypothetical protein TYRP_012721 [Tyrophagus putrescentiae]